MLKELLKDPSLLRQQAYVDGQWIAADDGQTLAVTDPSSGLAIASIPLLQTAEVRGAIAAADRAWPAWRAMSAANRCEILERWYQLVVEHQDDLALIMTAEQGKPLAEAKGEVRYGAGFIKWFAEEGRRTYGQTIPSPANDRRILTLKQPVGVCAAITPWNFPIAMITRKCAPALAAGCTIIVKPSELTPLSALALAELAERAGLPAGVFNVVTGLPKAIGDELTANPTVRKISFTGSTAVGRLLMKQSADDIKRLSLELGGNAPFIVFDDADIDLAVEGVMQSKFRNAGQTCVCANRVLVQAGIHDRFIAALLPRVQALKVGPGLEQGTTIGPLINLAAAQKVTAHLKDAVAKGAQVLFGQEAAPGSQFVPPTVVGGATTEMRLAKEETFGPLLPLFKFDTEQQALDIANATPYGLAAYFFTTDIARAWRVGEALEFGMVGLNTGSVSMEVAPFGGIKQSGLGREGASQGIDEYLEIKAFHMGGL
ncbi:NAD-dependent succinate-semialdehyde dehydrogenase [Pseudomonas sp. XS1P51]